MVHSLKVAALQHSQGRYGFMSKPAAKAKFDGSEAPDFLLWKSSEMGLRNRSSINIRLSRKTYAS
jgi:hypothetical protein